MTNPEVSEEPLTPDGPSLADVMASLEPNDHGDSRSSSPNSRSSSSDSATTQDRVQGSQCAIQVLYEGPPKCSCCTNWVEEYPDDLRANIEEMPRTKEKALVVRMGKNHGGGTPLALNSIVVQNIGLKETLCELFEGYKGITASLRSVVFSSPFHPFFYRWERLTGILERQRRDDVDAAAFTQLLYNTLEAELREGRDEFADLIAHGVITYPLLWALFEPGSLVYSTQSGHEQFSTVTDCHYNSDKGYMTVSAKFVDWDGKRFGYADQDLCIPAFNGTQNIRDLDTYPAAHLASRAEKEAMAMSRGQRFRSLAGFRYMAFSGAMRQWVDRCEFITRKDDGRVVLDAVYYLVEKNMYHARLDDLDSDETVPLVGVEESTHSDSSGSSAHRYKVLRRAPKSRRRRPRNKGYRGAALGRDPSPGPLSEKQLILCNTHVRGYSLRLKQWGEFEVDGVRDICWNDEAYPNLVLPRGYKDLIESFVGGQTRDKRAFDDVIEGKGLGVVMLLAGNPGTGKTLTAEAVADKARRPLYTLSAGELGRDADWVEKRLNRVLEMADKWDAVLLFDECDVFLQERQTSHLQHNEIVAVFLRVLEYYRGILIMTTNRANTIDGAFHSRIHLTLHYPDLDAGAREHIWRRLASHAPLAQDGIADDVYRRLAELPLNGRQIKNVIKISTLLAVQQGKPLTRDHFGIVVEATMGLDARGLWGQGPRLAMTAMTWLSCFWKWSSASRTRR